MATGKMMMRVLWVLALTVVITGISYVQPGARVEAEIVPISELVGQTPLYPESTLVINETNGTFTLVDQSGTGVLEANYTPALIGPYMDFLSGAGVSIEVHREDSKSLESGVMIVLASAMVLSMGLAALLMRRDGLRALFDSGASRQTLAPAAYRRLH